MWPLYCLLVFTAVILGASASGDPTCLWNPYSKCHEEWPDPNDRFSNYEACNYKYGFLPNEVQSTTVSGVRLNYVIHNRALEQCQQMYYRQKFCRNQWAQNRNMNYQRICKSINNNHLRFFASLFGTFAIGAFIRTVLKSFKVSLPYTVTLMLIGMGFGGLSNIAQLCSMWTTYTKIARTPPQIILFVFLPIIVFESSFNMKPYLFFRSIVPILTLAVPGMLVATSLTAVLCKYSFGAYHWTFLEAFLFGAIISATDPVAVVAILREVGTSETLGVLVDGESLLNDGVAILLFTVFSDLIDEQNQQVSFGNSSPLWVHIFKVLLRTALVGPIFGWVVAKVAIRWLSLLFNDATTEVTITLCAAYLTYYIADHLLETSGVMALVVLGITLSRERTCISPEVQGFVHHFWEMLSYLANTVLFVILGIVITERGITSITAQDGLYLLFLYVSLNVIRLLMIFMATPILSRVGYGLSWQNTLVMTWGGLRGAIGICLALQVFQDKSTCHKENVGPKILVQTAGIVLLTLLLNGSTTKGVLQMLRLTELSIGKLQDMANAVRQIRLAQQKALRFLRHDRFLADADWTIVETSTFMPDPYEDRQIKIKYQDESGVPETSPSRGIAVDPEEELHNKAIMELLEEARLRLLKALRVSCWRQFDQGLLREEALRILIDGLDKLEDRRYEMLNYNEFNRYWKLKGCSICLRRVLERFNVRDADIPLPKQKWRHCFYHLVNHWAFVTLVYLVILVNTALTIWQSIELFDDNYNFKKYEHLIFYMVNFGFTLLYLAEFILKVIGIGFGAYMESKWNLLDCIILIIAVIEDTLTMTYLETELRQAGMPSRTTLSQESDFIKFVRVIRIIRVLRIFRFVRPLMACTFRILDNYVNSKLFLGYDLCKGFITALDDVQKFLPQIVEHPRILLKFKNSLENQRVGVVKEMGLMQKDNPGIAIAVKTRYATRAVLNQQKETLHEMLEDGLIDETENEILLKIIEKKMKSLWSSPSSMSACTGAVTLANVPWMSVRHKHKELFEFIFEKTERLVYGKDDVISKTGDPPNGIYLIISGLVKIQYEPTFEMSVEREEYGIIPNTELFQDLTYDNEMEDYFSSGTVIGELGVLTDRNRGCIVTCETDTVLYHIPQSAMKAAIVEFDDLYDSLEARLWRDVGIRIAVNLLPNEPMFASWSMERIKAFLEKSAVPPLSHQMLVIPEFISNVVLIYGQLCNARDPNEVFTAPCLLPMDCNNIVEKPGGVVKPKLLLIADEEEDDDFGLDEEILENEVSSRGLSRDKLQTIGDLSLQKMIYANARRTSIANDDLLQIQHLKSSRAAKMGVGRQESRTNVNDEMRTERSSIKSQLI